MENLHIGLMSVHFQRHYLPIQLNHLPLTDEGQHVCNIFYERHYGPDKHIGMQS